MPDVPQRSRLPARAGPTAEKRSAQTGAVQRSAEEGGSGRHAARGGNSGGIRGGAESQGKGQRPQVAGRWYSSRVVEIGHRRFPWTSAKSFSCQASGDRQTTCLIPGRRTYEDQVRGAPVSSRNFPLCEDFRVGRNWRGRLLSAAAGLLRSAAGVLRRSEEHTSELQSRFDIVCRRL